MHKNVYYLHCQDPFPDDTIYAALRFENFPTTLDRIFDNSVLIYTDASFSDVKNALVTYCAKVNHIDPYFLLKVKQGTPTLTRFLQRSTPPTDPGATPAPAPRQE